MMRPPPRRRGWVDALVATALRWNNRLSRPLGAIASAPARAPNPRAAEAGAAGVKTAAAIADHEPD